MKNILSFYCFFFILSSVQAQNLEQWIEKWVEDGSNAFEKVEKNYTEKGNNVCGKILENHGFNDNGTGHFYAKLEIVNGQNLSRRELHTQFHALKDQLKAFSFFKEWTYKESLERYFGSVNYQKEGDGNKYRCELALKKHKDYEAVILSFEFHGKSKKEGKPNPLADGVRKVSKEDTTVLTASPLNFNQDIREVIYQPKGVAAFKALLAAAENDFTNVIGSSIDKNTFSVQANALNPTAEEPHQIIIDKGQMRTELHLRFIELFGVVGWRMEREMKAALKEILGDDWNIETKLSGEWQATLKNGKQHKRIVRRNKNNRDYLVIEVIKKPFRQYVEQYPQLLKGNCIEGNCIEGQGKFVIQEEKYYQVSYEGNFNNGYFDGIGFVYLEYFSKDDIVSFEFDHYSDDARRLLFMGNYKAGKRHGKGITYAYAQFKDDYRNFREKSEYFQVYDRTGVFQYVFQAYENDSLLSEKLCNFIYYNPNSDLLKIEKPFTTNYGQCVNGDCQNGQGVLNINGLGQYESYFSNGKAKGKGILRMPTGEWKSFKSYNGIPDYQATVRLPAGISRLTVAKRKVWLLADFDCLKGNCYNGEGLQLRGHSDRFRRDRVIYHGYSKGTFKDGYVTGEFEILSFSSSGKVVYANANEKGQLDGEIKSVYPLDKEPYITYYKDGVRVTKDGKNYAEDLAERIRKSEEKIERLHQERIAKQQKERAAAAAKAARKQRTATASSKPTKRRHSCSSCRGSGQYWQEYTTQDCTKTYDYTYSSGKYYQTYTNCRDVKRGGYIRCPVCGGYGWYWY